jgi:hypothetical protein
MVYMIYSRTDKTCSRVHSSAVSLAIEMMHLHGDVTNGLCVQLCIKKLHDRRGLCGGNDLGSYSRGARFESLTKTEGFCDFNQLFQVSVEIILRVDHYHLLPNSSQFFTQ